jgi:hypothetical protein
MACISLTTFNDLVAHVVDFLGANASADITRDARRAVLNAYRELASASIWNYYYQRGRLNTNADYTTGTITYTQANQTVTLTDGTFPSWAGNAMINFNPGLFPGSTSFQVVSNPTSTTLVLADGSNPGLDVSSPVTFTLYQDTYPLPADCLAINRMIMVNQAVSMWYESPGIWLERQRIYYSPAMPRTYTITGAPNYLGSMAIRFFPPPDNNYSFDFIYQRRPRQMWNAGYSTGKVTATQNSTALVGVGTNWSYRMVGQCIRIGSDGVNLPTGPAGNYPAFMERIVAAVNSATSITLDQIATDSISLATHVISDVVDLEEGAMLTALLRCCEKQISLTRSRTSGAYQQANAAYQQALILAREADSRSFAIETVGNSHMYPYRLANMPQGPDIP